MEKIVFFDGALTVDTGEKVMENGEKRVKKIDFIEYLLLKRLTNSNLQK
jgi:hypothetical protein